MDAPPVDSPGIREALWDCVHNFEKWQSAGCPHSPIFLNNGYGQLDPSMAPFWVGHGTLPELQQRYASIRLDGLHPELPPLPPFQGERPLASPVNNESIPYILKKEPVLPLSTVAYPTLPPSPSPVVPKSPYKRQAKTEVASSSPFKKQRSDPAELTNMTSIPKFETDDRVTLSQGSLVSPAQREVARDLAGYAITKECEKLMAVCRSMPDHPELMDALQSLERLYDIYGQWRESEAVRLYAHQPYKIMSFLADQLDLEYTSLRENNQIHFDKIYSILRYLGQPQPMLSALDLLFFFSNPEKASRTAESMPGAWPSSAPREGQPSHHGLPEAEAILSSSPPRAERSTAIDSVGSITTEEMAVPEIKKDYKLPNEPVLCEEQAALVELIASGRNVFYTGSAGCGKSTVLKAFVKRLQLDNKRVRILAPTGRAALQVNGSTTWTFAGWRPDHHKRPLEQLKKDAHGRFVWKRFKETDVIVIDEISMVENLHFERLNAILKSARGCDQAFGGIQIVVTGDFCQLPPVRPFQHCIDCGRELIRKVYEDGVVYSCVRHGEYRDEDKWAFKSKAWEECGFEHVHLRKIHRQSDEVFIKILQKCRMGERLSREDSDLLMDHKCMVHHATKLYATRSEVNEVNSREFNRLSGQNHVFWCLDEFKWQQEKHPHFARKGARDPRGSRPPGPLLELSDHRFADCVELKRGMLVVLLVNLDLEAGLCNGSQGIICGFEPYSPETLPRARRNKHDMPINEIRGDLAHLKAIQIKQFITDPTVVNKVWPVVRFHNGLRKIIYAESSIAEIGDEQPYSLLIRTQIPLAPAWAMTIHKSQSLTLDRVIVNLSRAFEEGQVYVALSRATGLHGLKIEGDREGLLAGLGGNREVQKFLRDKFGVFKGLE